MTTDQTPAPLRDVAQSAEATARYLADIQRVLLDIAANLETLHRETRVHCRGISVEGDRWYHARMRAMPVEKALKDVLKNLNALTGGLERSAYKRRSHDEAVVNTAKARKEKVLEKARKNSPQLIQAAPESSERDGVRDRNSGYSNPTSIYDLDDRRSA
ncbi:hypothetical protein [Streptomyces sp. NPDC001787]|uniref:hypothetical protein n=1 Tax=Streptomyces sp. NPDC001787 TaxID=3154523 RepID=UPI00331DF780